MRLEFPLALAACMVTLLTGLGPARAEAGGYVLTLESAVGRSSVSYEYSRHSYKLGSKSVLRQSAAIGRAYGDHVVGSVEASWVQRGATTHVRTIFRPDGEGRALSFERTYLDVGLPVSYRVHRAQAFLGGGLSPRLSFLIGTKSSPLHADYDKGPLFGVDPFITAGYGIVHLTARYLFDLVSAQLISTTASKVKVSDRVCFVGLGCDLPL